MITIIARLKALPGKEAEAVKHIRDMVAAVEAKEPGALAYISHTVPGSPGEFLFFEMYKDQATMDAHMATQHLQKLRSLLGTVLDPDFGVKIEALQCIAACVRSAGS